MHSICLLLVICLAASCQAIRVDWGTNTGPIVPPPPRTTPTPPRLPYREPAPVWEDQSDDIPNPKPYVYVLPPPSRPRTWIIPAGPYAPPNYNNLPPKRNYGDLLTPYSTAGAAAAGAAGGVVSVPALAAQYVPGVGIKYTAIVPNKQQGKYNVKTKKYKAYEKVKYAPWNYLQLLPEEEQSLDWEEQQQEQMVEVELVQQETHNELPQQSASYATTEAPSNSSDSSSSTEAATTLATTTTTTASTTSTHKPTTTTTTTTTTAAAIAAMKSAYLKKHNKLKKLIEMLQLHEAQGNSTLNSS